MSPTLTADTTAHALDIEPTSLVGPLTSRGRRNRRLQLTAGAVALGALGIGLAVPSGTSVHTVTGTVQLWQAASAGEDGTPCTGRGADADVTAGAPVRIKDANGRLLATAALGRGRSDGAACVFAFSAAEVARAGGYRISAGDESRPSVAYTFREIRSAAWDVRVTIGA